MEFTKEAEKPTKFTKVTFAKKEEPSYWKGFGDNALTMSANIGKVYPIVDAAVSSMYNMLVTLPAQLGGFVAGGVKQPEQMLLPSAEGVTFEEAIGQLPTWDINKARKTFLFTKPKLV